MHLSGTRAASCVSMRVCLNICIYVYVQSVRTTVAEGLVFVAGQTHTHTYTHDGEFENFEIMFVGNKLCQIFVITDACVVVYVAIVNLKIKVESL